MRLDAVATSETESALLTVNGKAFGREFVIGLDIDRWATGKQISAPNQMAEILINVASIRGVL